MRASTGSCATRPRWNKIMRMNSVTSTIEAGLVHLPDQANWLPELLHELSTFPRSKHDDQADSISQALDWIRQREIRPTVTFSTVYL